MVHRPGWRRRRLSVPNPGTRGAGIVTFEPGSRTAWHTHPLGQTLIVLSGAGRVQRDGGAIQEIRPGDVVQIALCVAGDCADAHRDRGVTRRPQRGLVGESH
jgi:quercetin dioxygenase-like cupin family protein